MNIPALDYETVIKIRKGEATNSEAKDIGFLTYQEGRRNSFMESNINVTEKSDFYDDNLFEVNIDSETLFVRAATKNDAKKIAIEKYVEECGYEPDEVHCYKANKIYRTDAVSHSRLEIIQ